MRLTLREAIDRGLRANLGLLLSGEETSVARGDRWQALSRLLPVVEGVVSGSQQEIDLDTMVGPNTLPPTFPTIAGPFHVFDARAYVSAPLLNVARLSGSALPRGKRLPPVTPIATRAIRLCSRLEMRI